MPDMSRFAPSRPRPTLGRTPLIWLVGLGTATLTGCVQLPTAGPPARDVLQLAQPPADSPALPIPVIEVDTALAHRLASRPAGRPFAELAGAPPVTRIGAGDALEISLWEAPPATLFGGTAPEPGGLATTRQTTLPEQVVDDSGLLQVPFVGSVQARDRTPAEIAADITERLRGKAHQPQVLVRQTRHGASRAAVVGEVANSLRLPLGPSGERLLDALASAGGVRQPVHKITLQLSRAGQTLQMPLEAVIRDPQQNIALQPGDVLTALHQPHAFTVLGATGRNDELAFEAQGISLAQALARAGGLNDQRASPAGVFIFRFEPPQALDLPAGGPVPVRASDGRVPVVYRLNLQDPRNFFAAQHFPVQDRDLLYVSNAPASEIQKFLGLVSSVWYPTLSLIRTLP